MKDLFWNAVFCFDIGGVIALGLVLWDKYPFLIKLTFDGSITLIFIGGIILVIWMILGFIHARITEHNWRNN